MNYGTNNYAIQNRQAESDYWKVCVSSNETTKNVFSSLSSAFAVMEYAERKPETSNLIEMVLQRQERKITWNPRLAKDRKSSELSGAVVIDQLRRGMYELPYELLIKKLTERALRETGLGDKDSQWRAIETERNITKTIESLLRKKGEKKLAQKLTLTVAKKLESDVGLSKIIDFDNIIFVPVIAFGNQTKLLERTLQQALPQEGKNLYLFLFNFPANQKPDEDIDAKSETVKRAFDSKDQLACSVKFEGAYLALMGAYRNGMIKGYLTALRQAVGKERFDAKLLGNKVFFIADDDIVKLQPSFFRCVNETLRRADKPEFRMVASPVSFDMPEIPASRLPAFYYAEVFRKETVREILGTFSLLSAKTTLDGADKRFLSQITYSDDIEYAVTTPLAFTANMFYYTIGDLSPKDEITRLVRMNSFRNLYENRFGIMSSNMEVVMDSRRALITYLAENTPSVFQWKGGYRFVTGKIDPARKFSYEESLPDSLREELRLKANPSPKDIAKQALSTIYAFKQYFKLANNEPLILERANLPAESRNIVLENLRRD